MEPDEVAVQIEEMLGPRLDRWAIEPTTNDRGEWEISLTHPASAGIVILTGRTNPAAAITTASESLNTMTEIDVASAAPSLKHTNLIAGLRTITKAFNWSTQEVRAVAFLLFEFDHLTEDEAAWLSGFEGDGAPMNPVSPIA